MRLNQNPNLRVEDFSSEQTWIGRLFIQLNPFIQSLNQIVNGNLDFLTNIKSVTRTFVLSFQGTFIPISFLWTFTDDNPNDLTIIRATKTSAQTPTILLPAWSYDIASNTITISRLTEVNASSVSAVSGDYQFTVRVSV